LPPFATGVTEISGKFTAGVVDTGDKFVIGVNILMIRHQKDVTTGVVDTDDAP
jgi:hypothetical protein